MALRKPLVVRIVVKGSPSGSRASNSRKARDMLMQAFKNWPALTTPVPFAVTPGGFVKMPFPRSYDGNRGWNSKPEDFRQRVRWMKKALLRDVVTEGVLKVARLRAKFLTVGIDLNDYCGVKSGTGGYADDTHAEIVAVVDTDSGKIVCCTGKSYPVGWQEKTLVQETNLKSHLFRRGKEHVLVLGCHDLNMFSNRSYSNQDPAGLRRKRCDKMQELVKKFEPSIILQHPHSTDSPSIWSTAWSGAKKYLPCGHAYASGIAYYNHEEKKPRRSLCDVLASTRCCDSHVLDVFVNGY